MIFVYRDRDPSDKRKRGRHKSGTEDNDTNENGEKNKAKEDDPKTVDGNPSEDVVAIKVEVDDITGDNNAATNTTDNPSDTALSIEGGVNPVTGEILTNTVPGIKN